MLTIIAFLFTIGLLVTIHEYGHFIVAKWCGVKILKFSIGFGKPLWVKKFGADQTELVIAAIPLGGYVKMLDEHALDAFSQEENAQFTADDLARAFNRQPVWHKIAIVLAGPVANFLLAIVLYWVLFMLGVVGLKPMLGEIAPASAAAQAGFKNGDFIQQVEGVPTPSWQDVRWQILNASVKDEKTTVQITVLSAKQQQLGYALNIANINHDDEKHDALEQLGLTFAQPVMEAKVGEVLKNSVADMAGLQVNDRILQANGVKISSWEAFVNIVKLHPNKKISLLIERNQVNIPIYITPESVTENQRTIGQIGAAVRVSEAELAHFYVVSHYSALGALMKATEKTWDTITFSLKMLKNMVTGNLSWKMMSGPITIANYAGQSANMGIKIFISFLALVSISIGVLNLLPVPVLDGGHLMYYVIEILTGKPVSESMMMTGQKIGLLLIGSMTILAFYNDINRMITG